MVFNARRLVRMDPLVPAGGGLAGVAADRTLPDPVTISVICPTWNRHPYHEGLYKSFASQNHEARDLWILDDSPSPSPFFLKLGSSDPRVHYDHAPDRGRMTTGHKRNLLIQRCAGSIVAHFDDDDWYAPNYLSSMLSRLRRVDADLVTLSLWNARIESTGRRFPFVPKNSRDMVGWGFSYVHRRSVAAKVSFPPATKHQDYPFVLGVIAARLRTHWVRDGADWAEHLIHR